MRKITSLLMLFLLCVGTGWGQEKPKYVLGELATHLEPGVKYVLYNGVKDEGHHYVAIDEGDASVYGKLCPTYDYYNKAPLSSLTLQENMFWEVEEIGGNNYYLKNVGTNKYVLASGNLQTNKESVVIQSWEDSECAKLYIADIFKADGSSVSFENMNKIGYYTISSKKSGPDNIGWCRNYDWNAINQFGNYGNNADPIAFYKVYEEISQAEKDLLIKEAHSVLEKKGVGYPFEDATERVTLKNALSALENNGGAQQANALKTAMKQYKEITNVKMPESGKAYICMVEFPDKKRFYLTMRGGTDAVYTDDPAKATAFVCRKLEGDKYMFVCNEGRYISGGVTGGSAGIPDSYKTPECDLIIKKFVKNDDNGKYIKVEQEGLFGYLLIERYVAGKYRPYVIGDNLQRALPDGGLWDTPAFMPSADAGYNYFSSAVLMKEVPYENVIKPNLIKGDKITGVSATHIATFSAPFATIIPDGVTGYDVKSLDEKDPKNKKAEIVQIEWGKVLPKNQGIILLSDGNPYTMIPSTTNENASFTGSKLGNTAGAAKCIEEGSFVLANGPQKDVTQFYLLKDYNKPVKMNRAYLKVPAGVKNFSLSMNFHNLPAGIDSVVNDGQQKSDAPVYDLTGRRVFNPVKGGIYIQNGRKYILK